MVQIIADLLVCAHSAEILQPGVESVETPMVFAAPITLAVTLAAVWAWQPRALAAMRTDQIKASLLQTVVKSVAIRYFTISEWQVGGGQTRGRGDNNSASCSTSRSVPCDGPVLVVRCCAAVLVGSAADCSAADYGPAVIREYAQVGRELEGREEHERLDMIALVTRGNVDKLETARGTYRFVDTFHYPGAIPRIPATDDTSDDKERLAHPDVTGFDNGSNLMDESPKEGYWEIVSGEAQFAWDNRSDKYHAIYQVGEQTGFNDAASGVESRASHAQYSVHGTFTPEYMMEYDTHELRGEIEGFPSVGSTEHYSSPVVYRRDPDAGKRQTRIVDIRDFVAPGGLYTWDLCSRAAKSLQSEQAGNERSSAEGGVLVFMKPMPRPLVTVVLNYRGNRQTIIVHDGSVGFNPVSFSVSSPRGSSAETTIEYSDSSGVCVPQAVHLKKYKKVGSEVALSYVRQCSLLDVEINESSPDQEIGTAAFHVPYACRMVDEIKGELFAYDDEGGFVPAADFVYNAFRDPNVTTEKVEPKGAQRSGLGRLWLIIVNVCVVLLVSALYIIRRNRFAVK